MRFFHRSMPFPMHWTPRAVGLTPLAVILLLPFAGCRAEKPFPYDNPQLGVHLVFPGPTTSARYTEKDTPYGEMEWFGASYSASSGFGASFHVQVGNLPPGRAGGTTEEAVLKTFEKWLRYRLQGLKREDLPSRLGAGFRYSGVVSATDQTYGIIIVARGRLHHAQAQGKTGDELKIRQFLDSFLVDR